MVRYIVKIVDCKGECKEEVARFKYLTDAISAVSQVRSTYIDSLGIKVFDLEWNRVVFEQNWESE